LDLAPVRVGAPDLYGQPTANGVNQENHNYSSTNRDSSDMSLTSARDSFLIDPRGKVKEEDGSSDSAEPGATPLSSGNKLQGDILLTLRLRYLRKAREAMQERDVTTGRWAQEQLQRGHELLNKQHQLQQDEKNENSNNEDATGDVEVKEEHTGGTNDSSRTEDSNNNSIEDIDTTSKEQTEQFDCPDESGVTVTNTLPLERSQSCGDVSDSPEQVKRRATVDSIDEENNEGNKEMKSGFTVNNYFEFLVDGELMSKAYALKEVVSSCDRITQWVHLNQKWADCLEFMESKLSQYNMADHMLRYAITINAHIRVISFFLAVAGADPNSQDRWLRTPLHFAAVHNRPDVVRVLLLAGADSSIPGALNKSLFIAPVTSSLSGALKSGRMITPTVLCQATYGNSLASVPAALTILRGKSCIVCNTLEATSLASVAKRRHSRIMNTRIPNMQVQASVRTNDTLNPTPDSSPSTSTGKVVISNCPKCNIPMCMWCLPDHHCIYDIIQEEFTWKVNLVKSAGRSISKSSDTSSLSSGIGNGKGTADGNAQTSKKGSKALRKLGKALFMRRPSLFGKSSREKEVIHGFDDDESDSDISQDSCSTASGELVSPNENHNKTTKNIDTHDMSDLSAAMTNSNLEANEDNLSPRESSDSIDSGFEVVHTPHASKKHTLEINVEGESTKGSPDLGVLQSPKVMFQSIFKRDKSGNDISATDQLDCDGVNTPTGFSSGLQKMKARMTRRKSGQKEVNAEEDVQTPKGGMPMYWIGYRDEANRQATLQPWQIIMLPLVQGGEYNRVLHRSGRKLSPNDDGQASGNEKVATSPTLVTGPDSDDDSDDESLDYEARLKASMITSTEVTKSKINMKATSLQPVDDGRVCDDDIHAQVREIYKNSFSYSNSSNPNSYTKRKEPKYLHFVSEMEGLYRTLERDATEVFAIEPLPLPPPMITSVTDSYLHVKHHKHRHHHHHHHPRNHVPKVRPRIDSIECQDGEKKDQDNDKFDSWDGVLSPEERVWVDSSDIQNSNNEAEQIDSPTIDSVPAFRSITAFSTDLEPARAAKTRSSELELTDQEVTQRANDAEIRFQQQLQIKGMNGLKKDALKKFLSGSWKLSEDDDMWVPDECAWYCRKCSEQFSLFKRKHHCRRCGNVFCDEDAPRVDASECLHESLQQAYQGVVKEEFGKKKEKIQFRLCMSCKNEIRHCIGLYIELDCLLPRYNFSTWLISLLSKSYNNMCQSSRPTASSKSADDSASGTAALKNVRLKKFAVAGHWMDSMADWLWRDRQLQLDNT